ncbi:hypothetical protein LEP1GSC043_1826 [Leptospira weilii str. Ecochallenge]|uniref:Uncharacterized protein n=1 Tax=Leptospira weilii str. Ecochallenge TaxID=1049986 RepID=N1UC97_9LEPT|nr:hypothetical protein LEP1GSC043_1826 [Leptospira weilii str. Ecochallenge]
MGFSNQSQGDFESSEGKEISSFRFQASNHFLRPILSEKFPEP